MTRFLTSAALVLALAGAPVALAQQPAQAVTVSYGDLNLASAKGVDALFSRIDQASRKVCGARPAHIMNEALTRYFACRDAVMTDTVRRIDVPAVTLAWADKRDELIQMASR